MNMKYDWKQAAPEMRLWASLCQVSFVDVKEDLITKNQVMIFRGDVEFIFIIFIWTFSTCVYCGCYHSASYRSCFFLGIKLQRYVA